MAEVRTEKRSYFAMLLSLIIPGFGQIYLRKPLKAIFLFVGVASGVGIIYMNSLPVNTWQDLIRLEGLEKWWKSQRSEESVDSEPLPEREELNAEKEDKRHYHVFTLEEGSKLTWLYKLRWPDAKVGDEVKFRVYWQFKVTGLIQGLVFWFYAIYDGWQGQRGLNKRAFRKKLKIAEKRHKVERKNQEQEI